MSDHDIVFVEAKVLAPRKKLPQRKIYLWKQADLDDISKSFLTVSPRNILQTGHRHNRLLCPVKDVLQPWINNKTKRLFRRKKRAYHRGKKSGKPAEDVTQYKQLQKDTQYQSKKAYSSYINNIVSEGSSAKKLYSFINGKRCERKVNRKRSPPSLMSSLGVWLHQRGSECHALYVRQPIPKDEVLHHQQQRSTEAA